MVSILIYIKALQLIMSYIIGLTFIKQERR